MYLKRLEELHEKYGLTCAQVGYEDPEAADARRKYRDQRETIWAFWVQNRGGFEKKILLEEVSEP